MRDRPLSGRSLHGRGSRGRGQQVGSSPGMVIRLSGTTAPEDAVQADDIGTISGGTGPYSLTDSAGDKVQINVDGVTLEVGSAAISVGTFSITIHDDGAGAPDKQFTITVTAIVAAAWSVTRLGLGGYSMGRMV